MAKGDMPVVSNIFVILSPITINYTVQKITQFVYSSGTWRDARRSSTSWQEDHRDSQSGEFILCLYIFYILQKSIKPGGQMITVVV